MRRIAGCVSVVAVCLALAGCSPDDRAGMRLSAAGVPTVMDCGAYFSGLAAYDADTGRSVWAASKPDESAYGVGEIEVGVLPRLNWVEVAPLQLEPSPTNWRLLVSGRGRGAELVEVAAAELSVDHVVLFDNGETVSLHDFRAETCSMSPISRTGSVVLLVLLGVALLIGIAACFPWRRRGRTED